MNVIHLFRTGTAGYGLERNILCTLPGLAERGVSVTAVGVTERRSGPAAADFVERLEKAGVHWIHLETSGRLPLRLARQLAEVFRAEAPDIIHSHDYKCDLGMLLADTGRAVRMTTIHGWLSRTARERLYEWINVQCCKRLDRVLVFCEDYRRRLLARGVPERIVRVIPVGLDAAVVPREGTDIRAAWGVPEGGALVAQIGRLSPEKHPEMFVEVAAHLSAEFPDARFALVGDGDMGPQLREAVAAAGNENVILFPGYVRAMADVVDAVDLVVNCSSTEGVPRTLLEAGAAGAPAVATDVGGVPDVVDGGVTGVLCPPGDVTALEDGVRRLIGAPALRERMGAAARERVATVFSIETCSNRLIEDYERLLPAARPGPGLKVLQVFETGGKAYGVERTVLSTSSGLMKQGIDVRLVVVEETRWGGMDGHTEARLRECGCGIDVIKTTARLPFGVAKALRRIVAREKPDIVHSHGYKCDIASVLSRAPAAKVATLHGWCSRSARERFLEWLGLQFNKRMDGVIALCEDYRSRLRRRGVSDARIRVVHAGIDPNLSAPRRRDFRREWGVDDAGVLVTQVGRLSPEKNPQLFVEVAKELRARFPHVMFALVGGGRQLETLRSEIGEEEPGILLAGYVAEVADVFRAADVVVNCSRTEGLPGALLEAGAVGRPVVATAVGGVPEIIEDGVTGLLCASGDADALEAGVARLIEAPELRSEMGAAARDRIATLFDSDKCAADLAEVYRSLVAQRASQA